MRVNHYFVLKAEPSTYVSQSSTSLRRESKNYTIAMAHTQPPTGLGVKVELITVLAQPRSQFIQEVSCVNQFIHEFRYISELPS